MARRVGVVTTTAWRWEHDRSAPRPSDLGATGRMTTLRETGQVQALRHAAQVYRQELARLGGVEVDEWDALRALELAAAWAEPLATGLTPEAWLVLDEDLAGLTVIPRIIRWERQAIVVSVRVSDGAPLLEADWTAPAIQSFADTLPRHLDGCSPEELRALVAASAGPIDVGGSPEKWRARLGPEQLDVSLVVQSVDQAGSRLCVSANARSISRGGRGRGRGRGRR